MSAASLIELEPFYFLLRGGLFFEACLVYRLCQKKIYNFVLNI